MTPRPPRFRGWVHSMALLPAWVSPKGMPGGLCEGPELLVGLRVTDAATADQNGPLGLLDDLRRVGQSGLGGGTALQTQTRFLKKLSG